MSTKTSSQFSVPSSQLEQEHYKGSKRVQGSKRMNFTEN